MKKEDIEFLKRIGFYLGIIPLIGLIIMKFFNILSGIMFILLVWFFGIMSYRGWRF